MKHGTLLALAMLTAAPTALADGLETDGSIKSLSASTQVVIDATLHPACP